MNPKETEAWLARLVDEPADPEALDALLRCCFERSAVLALQRLDGACDADDVASAVCQRLYSHVLSRPERLASFAADGAGLWAWVARVSRNAALDLVRRRQRERGRQRALPSALAAERPGSGLAAAELAEWKALLDRGLAGLAPEEREALVLRYFHELPSSRIGALLDAPAPTIRARIQRALAKLRDRLRGALPL